MPIPGPPLVHSVLLPSPPCVSSTWCRSTSTIREGEAREAAQSLESLADQVEESSVQREPGSTVLSVCEFPQGVITKRLINIHLQFIHVVDNFAKSFRRNKNFQNYRTDGKEQSKDFTGEKVNLKHLSILTPVGTWVCFLTSISPQMPQIKNHHVPAPSGERVKAVSSPGRKNTQMGYDLRHSISTPPIRSRGYKSETGKLCSGTETSMELNQGYSPCGTWGS